MPDPLAWLDGALAELRANRLLREPAVRRGPQAPRVEIDGAELLNFGANDYLGLAHDPRLAVAAQDAMAEAGWGAGASPLVSGRGAAQAALEAALAAFEEQEAALVFPSGFAANLGAISALVGRGDAVFSDALNHASIVDGCRLSRAETHVYRHADLDHLESLLAASAHARRRLIVTDGLFSMDGDAAPLAALARLAERHAAMLLVDEAHATGVLGPRGRGACEQAGLPAGAAIRVGTLSKALGSVGGFVAGPRNLIDWLRNRARPYVFSTALPAAASAAALVALRLVEDEPWRRERVLELGTRLRHGLAERGWNTGPATFQIIPILVGEAEEALRLGAELRAAGLFVPVIRPPTVPPGASRLRISLSALHTPEMIDALLAALEPPLA